MEPTMRIGPEVGEGVDQKTSRILVPAEPFAYNDLLGKFSDEQLPFAKSAYLPGIFYNLVRRNGRQVRGAAVIKDQGRSGFIQDPNVVVYLKASDLGLERFAPDLPPDAEQGFVMSVKGIGCHINVIDNLERVSALLGEPVMQVVSADGFSAVDYCYRRPCGGQNPGYARWAVRQLDKARECNRRFDAGLKIAPTVAAVRLPKEVTDVAIMGADWHSDTWPQDVRRVRKSGIAQEIRLMPASLRLEDAFFASSPFCYSKSVRKTILDDFSNLVLLAPRTLHRYKDGSFGFTFVGDFGEELGEYGTHPEFFKKDAVVHSRTGLYFNDLESMDSTHRCSESAARHQLAVCCATYLAASKHFFRGNGPEAEDVLALAAEKGAKAGNIEIERIDRWRYRLAVPYGRGGKRQHLVTKTIVFGIYNSDIEVEMS